MQHEGPALRVLERRLAQAPECVLQIDDPDVPTVAIVHDFLWQHRPSLHARSLITFTGVPSRNPWYGISRLICWLLRDAAFAGQRFGFEALQSLLHDTAKALQATGTAASYLNHPDRREELIRVVLAQLALRPAGETATQAQDRLAAVSSTERLRVMEAARLAEERAKEIREALAKKAAQEAADKWTRE